VRKVLDHNTCADLKAVLGWMAASFVCSEIADELESLGEILCDLRGREANSMRQLSKMTNE
jgi:hypothetical protein